MSSRNEQAGQRLEPSLQLAAWRQIPGGGTDAVEHNKALVRELTEAVWNRRGLDRMPDFYGLVILQIRDGKVRRQRGIVDNLNALRQLGVVPTPRS